jgi:hypothetical protein
MHVLRYPANNLSSSLSDEEVAVARSLQSSVTIWKDLFSFMTGAVVTWHNQTHSDKHKRLILWATALLRLPPNCEFQRDTLLTRPSPGPSTMHFFPPLYCLVHISRPDMLILCKQRSPPRNVISSTWIGQNGPRLWIEGAKLAKEGAERRIDPRNILGRISEVIPSPSFRGCTYSRGVCGAPTANVCVRVCVCVCVCV